jgi:photosystem II stability/assembly factor-like uncharacterized protein
MKKLIVLLAVLLVIGSTFDVSAQLVQWQSLDGPWFASAAVDISIGYRGNQRVIYVADSSAYSVLKSTNEGDNWMHLQIDRPFAVACIPDKPDTVYVARNDFSGIGMWKSTNGGTSFFSINQGFTNIAPRRIAISPHDEKTIYVGCFEYFPVPDATLFKTTNEGATWTPVPGRFQTHHPTVTSIVFHPSQPDSIWVGCWSNDPGVGGVYLTTDGGVTWQLRNNGIDNDYIGALVRDPSEPNTLYAGTLWFPSRIYKTTNGGENWSAQSFSTNNLIFGMAIDPRSPNPRIVYASTSNGVFKSVNDGTWTLSSNGLYDREAVSVAIDRQAPDAVYVGTFASMYRSSNGGENWIEKTRTIAKCRTTDLSLTGQNIFTVSANPLNPFQRAASLINGSFDYGSNWLVLLNNRLGVYWKAGFFGSAIASRSGVHLAGVSSPQQSEEMDILRSTDNGSTWNVVFALPAPIWQNRYVREIEFDPAVNNVVFAVTDWGVEASGNVIFRSSNAGASWTGTYQSNTQHAYTIEYDPQSGSPSQIILVGGEFGIIKSTNGGTSWISVGFGQTVFSLALNPTAPTVIYAGTASRIYKTTNGGATWSLLTNSPATKIGWLLLHPVTTSVVYAVAPDQQKVYRSTDDGATWSEYIGGLPQAAVHRVRLDIDNPNVVYAATDDGVYSIPHIWTGEIAANTTWRSGQTYLVEGKLNVPEGVTLTIQPGAVVQFDAGASLAVYGSLRAVGTANQPVRFELMGSARTPWYGIVLHKPTESTLSYCAISHAQYGVVASTFRVIQYPTITNCTITKCAVGIYLWGPLSHEQNYGIRSNRIEECDFGIVTNSNKYGSEPVLEDNVVRTSGKAGAWFARSSPVLLRNRFEHSRQEDILCTDGGNAQFGRNMRESEPGRNIVANNASVQLFAQYASPFLGLVDDEISCNLIAGGLNRVYHNSDAVGRVHATGSGTVVQADKNFWGYPVLDQWFIADHDAKIVRRCPLRDEETEEN